MSDMDALTQFLTARLDERARLTHAYDLVEQVDSARAPGWYEADCEIGTCDWHSFGGTESVVEDSWREHADYAHDLSWVLADVAAKRRLVERHTACDESSRGDPCEVVRLLALPYADHPDYDESWRP